jgi:uncharacterized Zn finger protein (UPF0148 family)
MVPGIDPPHLATTESPAMINVECPWCAGAATVEVADGDVFECAACAIRVEIAPEPSAEPLVLAA